MSCVGELLRLGSWAGLAMRGWRREHAGLLACMVERGRWPESGHGEGENLLLFSLLFFSKFV